MDAFFQNAQEIFDVARADTSGECDSFALVVRPDGGLHFIMDGAMSLEGAAAYTAARSAYIVTRSARGVKVEGRNAFGTCKLEEVRKPLAWLHDMPFYQMATPAASPDAKLLK